MKKKTINYTQPNIEIGRMVKDFLPSPKELKEGEEKVKVTLSLTKRSKRYFEEQAEKYNTKYQVMIRKVIDEYARANKG